MLAQTVAVESQSHEGWRGHFAAGIAACKLSTEYIHQQRKRWQTPRLEVFQLWQRWEMMKKELPPLGVEVEKFFG